MLILGLDSPVERVRLPLFATLFPMDHAFGQTRSIVFSLFPAFTLSSRRPDGRSKEHASHFSVRLLVSRCASRGRSACQESSATTKPRRVSAVFWPATATQAGSSAPAPALAEAPPKTPELISRFPVLWEDWPRCQLRRRWINLMRSQTVSLSRGAAPTADHAGAIPPPIVTRAERAHWRFTWDQRLARNARSTTAPSLTLTIHGLPATFAHVYGFGLLRAEDGVTNAA